MSEFASVNQPQLDQIHTRGRFAGRKALVTGGAGAIGRAVAERLISDGAAVAIVDLDAEAAEAVVEDLRSERIVSYCADVTKPSSLRAACDAFAAWLPSREDKEVIDCLVNCACNFACSAEDGQKADWDVSQAVNVTGYFNTAQACLPHLRRSDSPSIVNVSSAAAYRAQRRRWNYAATKGAILSLTRCMALDLSRWGVRVNSVSPGYVWSPEQAKVSPDGTRAGMADEIARYSMLGRDANTSEVASVVAFLCSRDASYVTAADLLVDGGYTAMGVDADAVFAGSQSG